MAENRNYSGYTKLSVEKRWKKNNKNKKLMETFSFWFEKSYKICSPCISPRFAGADQNFTTFFNIIIKICIRPKKKRLIESNAKCRHLKYLTCKGILRQVFICLRPRTQNHPPHIRVYNMPIHTGKGGES
jgi:hypothetical protein